MFMRIPESSLREELRSNQGEAISCQSPEIATLLSVARNDDSLWRGK